MAEQVTDSYYARRKIKLLKDFGKTADLVMDFVILRYGPDFADELYREARKEYEELIPQIPRIGGAMAAALNIFLIITAQELAVYRGMKKLGKTAEEAWEICHEALRLRMEKFPRIKRWLLARLMYSSFMRRRIKKRAAEGKQFKFGDFEIRWVIGDGKDFDFGVDYLACGNYELVKNQGAEEFAPYVCMSDIALGDALEWGLTRTGTLADGCGKCDFRFKKGDETHISSKTPEVQATIERMRKKEAS